MEIAPKKNWVKIAVVTIIYSIDSLLRSLFLLPCPVNINNHVTKVWNSFVATWDFSVTMGHFGIYSRDFKICLMTYLHSAENTVNPRYQQEGIKLRDHLERDLIYAATLFGIM